MQAVGVDAGIYKRPSDVSPFQALMGVAVTIRDRDRFRRVYDKVFNDSLGRIGAERDKTVYKAAHLTSLLLHNTNPFLRNFIDGISSELQSIDVFYTFYPKGTVDYIHTCRDSYSRPFRPEKFMKLISKAYEHYCVWEYCNAYPDRRHYLFEIDHFEGKITPAWDAIEDLPNLKIYFSGSECNKAISTSDLILRYIYNTNKGRLRYRNLKTCLGDIIDGTHLRDHFLGPRQDYLNKMAFRDWIDIDTRPYIKHPIYWIAWEKHTDRGDEKKSLEWDQRYNAIMQIAEREMGGVRFWEPGEFPHLVNEFLDVACKINEEATQIIDAIRDIAPSIRIWDLRSRE